MELTKLRNVENRVLSGLELDARVPFSKLGRRIRKSQQQVSYTANALIGKGVINGFYAIVDYSKLNVLDFRVYFKLSYISKDKYEELMNYLVSDPFTSWVAACGGSYDLICTFFARNPSQFNKNLRRVMASFPRQLENYTVLTTIVNRKFGMKYLMSRPKPEMIFGGDREPEEVDITDLSILDELSMDGRKSSVEIGEKLSLTPKTVIDRMKKLTERKILLGFDQLVDPRRMGYIPALLIIKYHNITPELDPEMTLYLRNHPNITWIAKTIGEWDIEVSIHARDEMELRNIEMDIRQRFANLIQKTESIPIYRNYKKNYFPRFLLEKENSGD
ncbi:MAG: Lrp/AsnC family transcriptional regulator [Candidatus Aenigmarchaeota archaeon]|nr:Lrp/AsnC family transcriptional regulator [Candidatus Aenigmarchaeota archaeon]